MAKLILKNPYIKNSGGASGYLKYIATRERVELLPDDRPPTKKQEQLVLERNESAPMVCSVMTMPWISTRRCESWNTTTEMCGHTSSRSSVRMLPGSALTTPPHGGIF